MDFKGQYLTFQEYKSLDKNMTIKDITSFNILEFEARKKIDERTQCRLKKEVEIPFDVKMCVFHLIDKVQNYAESINSSNGNVASESIDGYSVNYINSTQIKEIIESKKAEVDEIITTDLFGVCVNGTSLLYLGVR